MSLLATELVRMGRVWLRGALSSPEVEALSDITTQSDKPGARIDNGQHTLAQAGVETALMSAIGKVDSRAKLVRLISFNKSEGKNWAVPWHQDRVIAVAARHNVAGFTNWTMKAGVWHCEPPASLLEDMLFVRLHLDPQDVTSGAMQIAAGSHAAGVIPARDADQVAAKYPCEVCEAAAGDILVLKMLTLHCSKPAQRPTARRVLRLDFATTPLPLPLRWA